ncbi:MAG TPA: lipid-A-disaccharide synthase [Burkholderiales bacterium]|jgi:lipid-A-disaccharide synthase|nr:lipid-A-disaccharide synthase [Burkholderiales bacterium]
MSEPSGRTVRVAFVAGEASGDLLGAHLLQALGERLPRLEAFGIGGPGMQSAGLDAWYPMEALAVRGYVEVLKSLPKLLRIRGELRRRLLADPPDLFIGIDAPDFNLDLELALRKRGITTVHYASPSIWAWRGERIHKIKRAVSKMLALFPFEPSIYEKAGVPVAYVGHPLADELPEHPDKDSAREQMRLSPDRTVVALLPGSRQSEVRQMGELFAATAKLVAEQVPDVHFLVPLISRETRMIFEEALYHQQAEQLAVTILFGHAHMAMVSADAVLVASGTATLEAALLKRPMVITYKMPRLSAWIMRRKQILRYVGLPNILAGEFVVPEILQEDATAENLAQALVNQLQDKEVRRRLEQRFLQIHRLLRQGTAARAVEAILPLLDVIRQPVPVGAAAREGARA